MAVIGGSPEHSEIRGRTFAALGDASVKIVLGGYQNEVFAFGDGSSGITKTRVPASVEGLVVGIDHDRDDLGFLKEIADGNEFVDFTVTLASGHTFMGSMQITDIPSLDTQKSTCELKLAGTGELTMQ